ncbi:MAG: type III secretion system export apparatus subunit SctR [Casimicrobium sp.]
MLNSQIPDPVFIFTALFALSLIPMTAVMVTSYTKIIIVISLLRNALGLQNVPPASVTSGIALILTAFIMYPVMQEATEKFDPSSPAFANEVSQPKQLLNAMDLAREPMRKFLLAHSSKVDREFFMSASKQVMPPERSAKIVETDLIILIPAFTLTEITEAFEAGFIIFLPFVVIDLIVANLLIALGMSMMSPTMVSLPLKLLLFVVLDGWTRLFQALILSYGIN